MIVIINHSRMNEDLCTYDMQIVDIVYIIMHCMMYVCKYVCMHVQSMNE